MQKIEYCAALPGCCWACRSSNRAWYIDTGQSIDDYGAVYFCNLCIEEWASLAGMLSTEDADILRSIMKKTEDANFDLKVKVSGLEQAIDGLRLAGSVQPSPHSSNAVSTSSSTENVSVGEESVGFEGREIDESGDDSNVGELHSDESSPPGGSNFTLNL